MPTCGMWVSFVWSERLGQHDCWVTKPSCFLLGRERDREISRYQHNKSFKKCFPGKASVMNECKNVTSFHFHFCYIHSFLPPHAFSWKLQCSYAGLFYGTCERRRPRMRDCRTAEWTFIIMSLFLSRQECWARSRIIRLVLFHLLAFSVSNSSDDLVRIKYGEKDNCADGLNICLSSHHNHYTTNLILHWWSCRNCFLSLWLEIKQCLEFITANIWCIYTAWFGF